MSESNVPEEGATDLRPPQSAAARADADDVVRVAGVGASAGGLEAVSALLRALPADVDFAVVVVMHLDPTHPSGLVDLLGRVSSAPVLLARDGERVAPGRVYVIPPNTNLTVADGCLRVASRVDDEGRLVPIDTLLCALAEDLGPRGAAVILSGTGADGARGVAAVRAAGGLTFAQDATAAHAGMPEAAVATGAVGAVLPPDGIAQALAQAWPRSATSAARDDDEAQLQAIFALLRESQRMDFSHYKRSSFLRRVLRRVQRRGLDGLRAYVALLREDPDERVALGEDVLIHVTSFFRDVAVFDALKAAVLPRLVEGRSAAAPIRVWVPGCSSGEEVYSLAICLLEYLTAARLDLSIKMFGTDIGAGVIDRARAGRYGEEIRGVVSPARLERFFQPVEGGYQIRRDVRDLCVFARHDVTRDPPFSGVDLVSCRNLLIYLDATLQARVIPVFQYALRQGGFLVLGGSERAETFSGLVPFDARHRIYLRSGPPSRIVRELHPWAEPHLALTRPVATTPSHGDIQREADRAVLAAHGPPGVVVTEDFTIVQFRGQTGAFMEHTAGPASLDLLHVAREDLRYILRRTLDEAKRTGAVARGVAASARDGAVDRGVEVEALPLQVPSAHLRLFVVSFRELAPPQGAAPGVAEPDADRRAVEQQLRQELASTREYLQSVVEQLEAGNEELRAANEEVVSSNEELHSTNEELQTAKEELQASNEELTIVNGELMERNVEATRVSDDLTNILASVAIPLVMFTRDGAVRSFTPPASRALGLTAADVGRPLRARRADDELSRALAAARETFTPREFALRDESGRWQQASVRPYLTVDGRVDGFTLALFDVDDMHRAEQRAVAARDYAEAIVATVRESILVLDGDLRVVSANRAYHDAFGMTQAEAQGRLLRALGDGLWDRPALLGPLADLAASTGASELRDLRVEIVVPKVGRRVMLLNARRMAGAPDAPRLLLAIEDVTDRLRDADSLRARELGYRDMLASAAEAVVVVDPASRVSFANHAAHAAFGYAPESMVGLSLGALIPDEARARHAAHVAAYCAAPTARKMASGLALEALRADGTTFPVEVALAVMHTVDGVFTVAFVSDVSARRAEEARAAEYQTRLQRLAIEVQISEERERRRIAVGLHDQVGQSLALVEMQLRSVRGRMHGDDQGVFDACVALVERAVNDTRTLIFDLSPPILYDLGLRPAIEWLVEDFATRYGMRVVVEGDTVAGLDPDIAAVLYRAVRELLTNVAKHAASGEARVTVSQREGQVVVDVEDRGAGFDVDHEGAPHAGFGLFSVREQVHRIRGAVEVASALGVGTRVRIQVPSSRADAMLPDDASA